jgi:hypothetical protein
VHSGEFVAQMEAVVEVDHRPYTPQIPLGCMEEQPVPWIQEVRPPPPAAAGKPERYDYASARHGTAPICMCTEPLTGGRTVRARAHKTASDWATAVQQRLDTRYPQAERLGLVGDHLHTQGIGAL